MSKHVAWLQVLFGTPPCKDLSALLPTARYVRFGISLEAPPKPVKRAPSKRSGIAGRSIHRRTQTQQRVEEVARRLLAEKVERRRLRRMIADELGVSTNCVADYLVPFLEAQENISR